LMIIWLAHKLDREGYVDCFIDGSLICILNVYNYDITLMTTRMMRRME